MFSRWAVKRVCKFVLKKKLAQFDVQLSKGTIQLGRDQSLRSDGWLRSVGGQCPIGCVVCLCDLLVGFETIGQLIQERCT
ncbi:unnamed protein product [Malus baccata var. baccata]